MTITRITDFTAWDLLDEFTPNEAAYLWFEAEPNHGIGGHSGTILSLMNTLGSAIDRGELSARKGNPRLWSGPYIQRESLRQWAERKGQRPLFLFPEDRTPVHAHIEAVRQLQSEIGKETATQQHAHKNRWYRQAEKAARDLWEKGSTLTHNKMAAHLFVDTSQGASLKALQDRLKPILYEMGKPELILGVKKIKP